ncbi:MAG: BolA family transcriptional regulator [Gammaproteobacteria bacterium]
MNETRIQLIRSRLDEAFSPEYMDVEDESHLHEGHAGARDGRGHFRVTLVSPAFAGQSRIQRHRMVFDALGSLMQSDIHALAVKALAPDEV